MSWAERLKVEAEAKSSKQKRAPLAITAANINGIKKQCKALNQDICVFITGREGSGKSTLASHIVRMFDPDFSIDDGMIYSLKGEKDSLVSFMDKYKDVPFKTTWYDEAVSVLFSLRHSTRESAEAQELFKVKRESRHFDILVSPSFWDLVPDIRERRVSIVLYCFFERAPTKIGGEPRYVFKVACFNSQKIPFLSMNKAAKLSFGSPDLLFKTVRPNYIEEFPPMVPEFAKKYMLSKHAHRDAVLNSIRGGKLAVNDVHATDDVILN